MPLTCWNCLKVEREEIHQLDYQHCMLLDVPSDIFAFERTLEELYLDSNRIRDLPRPLFHCHELKILSITDNEVQSLPPAIASLINLERLDLSKNGLTYIPDNIKGCKHLMNVDVSVNPLEKLPEGFTQLISLQELYLNDTYLEFLPANFGRLSKLRILELRENNLNTLPKSISRLANLQRLDIGQNAFSELPEVVGSLLELRELWIDFNKIRQIPNFIGNLKNLVHFEASNNNIVKISANIGHCDKMIDLTLTSNEIQELPDSIGCLTNLITLKLDDNHLKNITLSLGKLVNLEELIINQNDLMNLSPSIGLLRKLIIINCDDNILEEIPSELGSCSSLKVFSARGNNLRRIPDEIGHLINLRMMNISENQLQYLPVAILKLTKLTALWISTNQSTPLTTLQQEIDKTTGKIICTNFMFPQSAHSHRNKDIHFHQERVTPRAKPHIRFASDSENEMPSRLMRAPTPYPKELRAMAKHARFIQTCQNRPIKEIEDNIPLLEELISPGHQEDIKIKEAKVKRPCANPAITQDFHQHNHYIPKDLCPANSGDSNYSQCFSDKKDYNEYYENSSNLTYNYLMQCEELESTGKDHELASTSPLEIDSEHILETENKLRNGPYAAYSLRSDSESNLNKKTPSEISLVYTQNMNQTNSGSQLSINSCQISKQKLNDPPMSTLPEPPPYHIAATYSKSAALYQQAFNSIDETKYSPLPLTSLNFDKKKEISHYYQDNNISTISNDKLYSLSANSFSNLDTNKEHYIEEINSKFSNDSANYEDKINNKDISRECKIDSLKEHYEEIDKHSDHLKDHDNFINNNHHQKINSSFEDPTILTSPKTFTQDKPSVRNGIIMPTPQRPTSLSKYNNLSQNSLHESYNHSTSDNLTTSSSPFPGFPSSNHSSLGFQESRIIYSDLNTLMTSNNTHPHNPKNELYPTSPNKSHLYYLSNKTGNYLNQEISVSTEDIHPYFDNEHLLNYPENFEMKKMYATPCEATIHPSLPDITQVTMNIENKETSNENNQINKQYLNKTQWMMGQQNNSSEIHLSNKKINLNNENIVNHNKSLNDSMSKISDSSNGFSDKVKKPIYTHKNASLNDKDILQNRDASIRQTWMFGLHKNPTVFPVTIKNNSRLGFTLLDEMKTSGIQEQQGIFVGHVEENGPAHRILKNGDKILQIDNIDVTKLQRKEVIEIFNKSGFIVNMMISRQH